MVVFKRCGRIYVLYGLHFDSNPAAVKQLLATTVSEMCSVLKFVVIPRGPRFSSIRLRPEYGERTVEKYRHVCTRKKSTNISGLFFNLCVRSY